MGILFRVIDFLIVLGVAAMISSGQLKLLHTPSLEESGVGRVLLDIGGVTLFSGVEFALFLRRVFADFGIVASSFLASVGGRHGRHFIVTRHIVGFPF
jgi:hypothetical protein